MRRPVLRGLVVHALWSSCLTGNSPFKCWWVSSDSSTCLPHMCSSYSILCSFFFFFVWWMKALLLLLWSTHIICIYQGVVKSLSHHIKLRSGSITSNTKLALQKTTLRSTLDILVATPGKFLQNMERGQYVFFKKKLRTSENRKNWNCSRFFIRFIYHLSSPYSLVASERVWLSDLRYLVVDESDTLFDTSFQEDLVRPPFAIQHYLIWEKALITYSLHASYWQKNNIVGP